MSYTGAPVPNNQPASTMTLTASPTVWQNTNSYSVRIIISGGVLTNVEFSRDGTTYYPAGAGMTVLNLNPGDFVRISYTVLPASVAIIPTR